MSFMEYDKVEPPPNSPKLVIYKYRFSSTYTYCLFLSLESRSSSNLVVAIMLD